MGKVTAADEQDYKHFLNEGYATGDYANNP